MDNNDTYMELGLVHVEVDISILETKKGSIICKKLVYCVPY